MKVFAVASLALAAQQVSAHGYISSPAARFQPGAMQTNYVKTISESINPAFAGKKWNDNPEANAKMFTTAFASSSYKSLREMLDSAVPDCGFTLTDGTPVDVSSLKSMKWQNDQEQKGFIDSHHGPCELWIDDTKIMHSDDCRADYTAYPAEIPVDYSVCKGKCQLTFYWLALHEPNWQIYKQCVPIQNGSGGGSSSTPATTTKAPSTNKPAATTVAPATGGDDEYDDEYSTPAPSTQTPPAAATPSATKKACKGKSRRMTENLRKQD
uniref:Uncharacterized protein n=1 Tax=Globisporangium ultimum (strain ATCC 200006 / CBS 805.95 / DAOM BR144) TaxID=431595 RepID=K3WLN8_GLOUD